jgi:plasmid stabilization system protein ParE
MGELNWTDEAQHWLRDIFDYIAADDAAAAARTVQKTYDRAQLLARFPELGYRYGPSNRQVRVLLSDHYRIAYLVRDGGTIDILGVFHGALDLDRYEF